MASSLSRSQSDILMVVMADVSWVVTLVWILLHKKHTVIVGGSKRYEN